MPSGKTHSSLVFHGWGGRGESQDEILKCGTYAFPNRFLYTFCSHSVSVTKHFEQELPVLSLWLPLKLF